VSIQLSFHNTQFSVVHHDNQTWLTSKELAQALQYANDRAVTMIFNKHSDEFTQCMTRVLEVSTSGNIKACCRIFSLRGAHLIAMFARTPVAKEFRRWVLDVLDREVGTAVITPVKPVVKTRREEVYYENDIPVARRPIGESEVLMSPESCLEHVMRSGYVIIPCDELGKMTLDELWQMAEETRKLRDRVRKNYQELATRYDF
jgi:prophage antirepressor-like protein